MTYRETTLQRLRAEALELADADLDRLADGDPVRGVGLVLRTEECRNSRGEPWCSVDLDVGRATYHADIFSTVQATLGGAPLLPGHVLEFLARASVAEVGVTLHLVECRVAGSLR